MIKFGYRNWSTQPDRGWPGACNARPSEWRDESPTWHCTTSSAGNYQHFNPSTKTT